MLPHRYLSQPIGTCGFREFNIYFIVLRNLSGCIRMSQNTALSAHLIIINKDAKPLLTGTFRDFYLHDFVAKLSSRA